MTEVQMMEIRGYVWILAALILMSVDDIGILDLILSALCLVASYVLWLKHRNLKQKAPAPTSGE